MCTMSKDSFLTLIYSLVVIGLTVVCGIGLGIAVVHYKCNGYSAGTNLETKVVVPYCFVKVDNTWFSLDELRHDR